MSVGKFASKVFHRADIQGLLCHIQFLTFQHLTLVVHACAPAARVSGELWPMLRQLY